MYESGTLALVKADPAGYKEVGSFKVGDRARPHWAHPAIVDGKLIVRDQDRILVYDIRAGAQ